MNGYGLGILFIVAFIISGIISETANYFSLKKFKKSERERKYLQDLCCRTLDTKGYSKELAKEWDAWRKRDRK